MGIWDGAEYLKEVNWPGKKLKKCYDIEMCFPYPEVDKGNRIMWCCGKAEKVILVDIELDSKLVASNKSKEIEEELDEKLCNPEKSKKGAWRQYV